MINAGADVRIKNNAQETPLDYLVRLENKQFIAEGMPENMDPWPQWTPIKIVAWLMLTLFIKSSMSKKEASCIQELPLLKGIWHHVVIDKSKELTRTIGGYLRETRLNEEYILALFLRL